MNKALAGLGVALTLGVGLAVGVAAGGILAPRRPPSRWRSRPPPPPRRLPPRRSRRTRRHPARRPRRRWSRRPTPPPSPTPEPTPSLVPAPLTGRLVKPEVASRHVDRGDGRRPVRRPAAVRPELGRRRVAGARRGRHPALHGAVPDGQPEGRGTGPQLALLLHRAGLPSGARSTSTSAARRRRWRCCARPRARARSCTTPTGSATRAATCGGSTPGSRRTTCTPTRKNLRTMGKKVGAKAVDYKSPWKFGARQAARRCARRAARLVVPYLANKITYKYDRKTNIVPAVGDRRVEADRRVVDRSGSRPRTSW